MGIVLLRAPSDLLWTTSFHLEAIWVGEDTRREGIGVRKADKSRSGGSDDSSGHGDGRDSRMANDYRDYKIVLSQQLSAIVNICLKAESYDEGNRDYRESCTGKVPSPSKHELTVQITDRHRVWLNVNVLAGESADQITLHNGYSNTLQRHVFEVHWCAPVGTLYIWQLECISD